MHRLSKEEMTATRNIRRGSELAHLVDIGAHAGGQRLTTPIKSMLSRL